MKTENLLYISAIGIGVYSLNEVGKLVELRNQYKESTGVSSSVTDSQIMAPKVAAYALIGFGALGLWHSFKS